MADKPSFKVGTAPWETVSKDGDSPASAPQSFKVGSAPWETEVKQPAPEKEGPSKTESALRGAAQGASLGFADEITGATEALWEKAKGNPEEFGRLYAKSRNESRQNYKTAQDANPASYGMGEIGGALATTAIPGLGAAKGVMGAVKVGAALGGAQALGSSEADNVKDLALDTVKGTGIGAGLGLAGGLGAKAVEKAKPVLGMFLKDVAESQAYKSVGAMLKDFRSASAKDAVNSTGRFALDNGLVKAGDTVADVAEKAGAVRQAAGKRLDKVYNEAGQIFGEKAASAGFNPITDKEAILKAVREELGDTVGAEAAVTKVSNYLDEVAERHTNKLKDAGPIRPSDMERPLDPRSTNNVKSSLDEAINYARNPLTKEPAAETAYSTARKQVANRLEESINSLGGDDLVKELKAANRDYGSAKTIERIANDRVNRESANKMFGLTDTIAAAGAAGYGATTGDWKGAVGIFGAKKLVEKYGASTIASAANKVSQRLLESPEAQRLVSENPKAFQAAVINITQRVMGGGTAPAPAVAGSEGNSKSAPVKGQEKWAKDGLENLKAHGDVSVSDEELLSNPKTKRLLISASDLKPGSKAMEKVAAQVQAESARGSN